MEQSFNAPQPTDHPEFSPAAFYFSEFLPLLKRVEELEFLVGYQGLQLNEEAENTAYLGLAVEELQEEQGLSKLLHEEQIARLSQLEARPTNSKLRGWGSSSHKPGGSPNGKAL